MPKVSYWADNNDSIFTILCCLWSNLGGHFGRDKTLSKIAERFYWKTMWKDVEEYVRTCPTCQMTNDAKFQKAPAPLHPIAVKSKVWHQVNDNTMLWI